MQARLSTTLSDDVKSHTLTLHPWTPTHYSTFTPVQRPIYHAPHLDVSSTIANTPFCTTKDVPRLAGALWRHQIVHPLDKLKEQRLAAFSTLKHHIYNTEMAQKDYPPEPMVQHARDQVESILKTTDYAPYSSCHSSVANIVSRAYLYKTK